MENRFDFLGVSISSINLSQTVALLRDRKYGCPGYICFPDLSVVREAGSDPLLRDILNASSYTLADGKPSQFAGWLQGYNNVGTVSGFHLCSALLESPLTHYFYGADDGVLSKMKQQIRHRFPDAAVLGYKAPPFVGKNDIAGSAVIDADMQAIKLKSPDLIWIGISSPKQDYLMHHFYKHFDRSLFLGVGGVFLYFANEDLKSPEWMKKMGMRWLYRLSKEPKRLWPKYYSAIKFLLVNSGYFLKLVSGKVSHFFQAE